MLMVNESLLILQLEGGKVVVEELSIRSNCDYVPELAVALRTQADDNQLR